MKKLTLLMLLMAFTVLSKAQTVSLALVTPPCDSNGVVVATFTGLTDPITVYWYTGSGNHYDTVHTGSTDTLFGFTGGTINMSGTDTFGANVWDSAYYAPAFAVSVTTTSAICPALPVLSATSSGGSAPYTYKWTDYYTNALVSTSNPASVPASAYYCSVTDAGGCVVAVGPTEAISTPDFTYTVTTTNAVCPSNGSGNIAVTGGTPPFSYQWTNMITSTVVSTSNPASLPGGYYKAIVTDALGCSSGAYDVMVTYTPDFTASVTTTDANCTDGTATVAITGGVSPFTYLWSNGATTPSISGLIMGYYTLTLTDALGCHSDSAMLGGYVNQVTIIDANTVSTPATCLNSDGSAAAFGSGGTPPYSYLWSNGATTSSITGIAANYYDVTVTDAIGCLGSGGAYVSSSTPIYVSYATTPSSCTAPTGTCTLSITGGTAPYNIHFYSTPMQTTATATNLAVGNYYFDITDAVGCTQSGTVTIPPIDVIALSFTATPATCTLSNGSVSVAASGGVSPYTYHWSSGSATTPTLSSVPYGLYYATVTDANGCSVTNCQQVPYSSPLTLGLSSTSASCIFTADGSITAVAGSGTPPYTYSMGGSSASSVTVSGLATGPYWIYVSDAHGCTTYDYTYVDYNVSDSSCFCVIKGTVYHDMNDNCLQDAGEPGINHVQMQCSGIGYTYTDADGNYSFLVPTGSYTVSQTLLAFYPLSSCQSNHIPVSTVSGTGCVHTINFADTLDPIHDIHVSTWDYYNNARPGFPYTQTTVITNDGTVTESGILASYTTDGQIYAPTFVPTGVYGGSSYNYSSATAGFPVMAPGDGLEFLMTYNVPASVPLGTNLVFKDSVAYLSPMSNWLNDYSPWNNVNYFTTTVVGSYDPNFKEVNPKGTGPNGDITYADSILEYMVHFQNTGSFEAENVVVIDTLDPNLDWTTLHPEYSSKKCTVTISETGVAKFTFSHIDLPASSSEPIASNAMFTYTVKTRSGLPLGTQFKNRASIYFDYNAPIVTNRTVNTLGHLTNVNNVAATATGSSFAVFPNPADNLCSASVNSDVAYTAQVNITDVAGRTMTSKEVSVIKGHQNISLDIAKLAPGVYFVTLSGNGNPQTQKLVIMK